MIHHSHSWVYIWKKKKKTLMMKDTCIPRFTAVLFTVAKTRQQPSCLWGDEWTKKL